MSAFSNWLNSVNGRAIEMDKSWGAQCWDLWSHYAVNMIGATYYMTGTNAGSGGCPQHSGYTCGLWKGFNTSGLGTWFTPVQGPPQRGDVAVWDYGYPSTPLSHVAIVVEDRGANVYCMTQNPGPAHYALISKQGIMGYLRPDNQSFFDGAPAPSAPTASGSIADLAAAVIRGEFGNGPDRVAALGDKYDAVQAEVNRILGGGGSAPAPAPAPAGGSRQHVVVPGDTLWDISAAYLGDGSRYMEIFNISNFSSGNPALIFPGEIANIP